MKTIDETVQYLDTDIDEQDILLFKPEQEYSVGDIVIHSGDIASKVIAINRKGNELVQLVTEQVPFLIQIMKRDRSIVNIGVWDRRNLGYFDDSGTLDDTEQTENLDYEYMTFRDMRVNLNACDFLKGGKL